MHFIWFHLIKTGLLYHNDFLSVLWQRSY